MGNEVSQPLTFSLGQAYPNPFNPSTVVPFSLAEDAFVSMKVYNVLGREVMSLVSAHKQAGVYRQMVAMNDLPAGMYFLRLDVPGHFSSVRKLVLVK